MPMYRAPRRVWRDETRGFRVTHRRKSVHDSGASKRGFGASMARIGRPAPVQRWGAARPVSVHHMECIAPPAAPAVRSAILSAFAPATGPRASRSPMPRSRRDRGRLPSSGVARQIRPGPASVAVSNARGDRPARLAVGRRSPRAFETATPRAVGPGASRGSGASGRPSARGGVLCRHHPPTGPIAQRLRNTASPGDRPGDAEGPAGTGGPPIVLNRGTSSRSAGWRCPCRCCWCTAGRSWRPRGRGRPRD